MSQVLRHSSSPPIRIAWLQAILLIATFLRLSGQGPPTLPDSGSRVRVSAPGLPRRVTGTLQAWRLDTLVMVRDSTGDTVSVAFDAVRRIEVSQGKRSDYDIGALAGLVFGAGIDALWVFASSRSGGDDPGIAAPFGPAALPVVMAAFAALGSIVGSTTESERWRHVPLARPGGDPRLALVPLDQGRMGVGLRIGL